MASLASLGGLTKIQPPFVKRLIPESKMLHDGLDGHVIAGNRQLASFGEYAITPQFLQFLAFSI